MFFVFMLIIFIFSSIATTEITPDNCYLYLEQPLVQYNINIETANIEWDNKPEMIEKLREYENRFENEQENLDIIIELILLYNELGIYDKAKNLALEKFQLFKNRINNNYNEISAIQFAEIILAANLEDQYSEALLFLYPYIEKGEAQKETYDKTISLCLSLNLIDEYQIINDVYINAYPEHADAYYQKFSLFFLNINKLITNISIPILEDFSSESGELLVDESNAEIFIKTYIQKLTEEVDYTTIDKVIELEPDNYEYNIMAATFSIMEFYMPLINILNYLPDDIDFFKILSTLEPKIFEKINLFLEKAENIRPQRDIQVYLSYALFNIFCTGDFNLGREYSQLAIDTRPDLPQGYDALILSYLFPFAMEETTLNDEKYDLKKKLTVETILNIIENKIINSEGESTDFAIYATFKFQPDEISDLEVKDELLDSMKIYLDKSLELDPDNHNGILGMGNYYIFTGEYEKAIDIYSNGLIISNDNHTFLLSLFNNRGIANILFGKIDEGMADLKTALFISGTNKKTLNALEVLEVD